MAVNVAPLLQYVVVPLLLFVTLPWDIKVIPGPVRHVTDPTDASLPLDTPEFTREIVYFDCSGERCEAWLYLPKPRGDTPPPVVVMGHGLGGQKDMGLDRYAAVFARGGLAVFVFDYRTFGGSSGEPRNWVSPGRHLADWRAAVRFVQTGLGGAVDPAQLCLWGSSFAGGHVLVIASELGDQVAAVVSQVPHLDGVAASKRSVQRRGLLQSLRMAVAGVHDHVRTTLFQPAAYLPLVGPPGSMAFMQLEPHELEAYYSKHPKVYQGGWRNIARATLALELSRYSPIRSVPNITAPLLFLAATNDTLCPPELVHEAASRARDGRVLELPVTHFDLYRGETFDRVVAEQRAFLLSHVALGGGGGGGERAAAVADDGAGGADAPPAVGEGEPVVIESS